MDTTHCHVCGTGGEALFSEQNNPHEVLRCGRDCQRDYHGLLDAPIKVMPNPKAHSLLFRSTAFYRDSAALLRSLKRDDVFAFLSLSHYGQQAAVNPILFKAEGDWNRIAQYMGLIPNFSRMMDPHDHYDIWDKFFASMLELAPGFGAPFTDRSGKHVITSKADMLRYYPEMRPYLEMKDKVLFVRLYISAIQSAILSVPHSLDASTAGWRGYSPITVPNSLSQDLMRYQTGERITNWGLGSVSLHHALSSGFANLDKACCMMFIHFPAGFPIMMLTSDKDDKAFPSIPTPWRQMEILLPAGTIFQIGAPMGRLAYQPYNKGGGTQTYHVETREVWIVGLAHNKGYVDKAKRFRIVSSPQKTKKKKKTNTRRAREARLKRLIITGYHQTSAAAAQNIVATQVMFMGKTGYAGGGIYFASDPRATQRKAVSKGVILKASVLLGKSKTIYAADGNITFESLRKEGYDSIFLLLPSGPEYVVYNSDQVRNITIYTGDPNSGVGLRLLEATAAPFAYRQHAFYRASMERLQWLKANDIFAYLCLAHYGNSTVINRVMFDLRGDWEAPITDAMLPFLKEDSYQTYFAYFIERITVPTPLTDPSGTQVVSNESLLMHYYPAVLPYLMLLDPVRFVRLYMSAIQSAILGVAIGNNPPMTWSWRGYKAIASSGRSLAMNPSAYKQGETVTNWGLTSISLEEKVAVSFSGFAESCCMMVVLVPSSFPIFLFSADQTDTAFPALPTPFREVEVLLPAGTRFRIGKNLGKRRYEPSPGIVYMIDTIEVMVLDVVPVRGYITPQKRAAWVASQ